MEPFRDAGFEEFECLLQTLVKADARRPAQLASRALSVLKKIADVDRLPVVRERNHHRLRRIAKTSQMAGYVNKGNWNRMTDIVNGTGTASGRRGTEKSFCGIVHIEHPAQLTTVSKNFELLAFQDHAQEGVDKASA